MCDKHVVKMVLESAQLLSTVHRTLDTPNIPDFIYKATHKNHPCSVWARESVANYVWLVDHALALCVEYTYRYKKIHKSHDIILWCRNHIPAIEKTEFTAPAQAMPDRFKNEDPVVAYRDYYFLEKREKMPVYWAKDRKAPDWYYNRIKESLLFLFCGDRNDEIVNVS
jgi:hypothetical protein